MSYIRCLSNPEGLYIWGESSGRAYITHHVKKPHSSGRNFDVPLDLFNKLLRKWGDTYPDKLAMGGIVVEEVQVHEQTGKILPTCEPCKRCKPAPGGGFFQCKRCYNRFWKLSGKGRFVIRLSYKKDFINLWKVTWEYIVGHEREYACMKKGK